MQFASLIMLDLLCQSSLCGKIYSTNLHGNTSLCREKGVA